MKTKTYANTLLGFNKWMKDNPLDENQYGYKIGDFYIEFRQAHFHKRGSYEIANTCVYGAVRIHNGETFKHADDKEAKEVLLNNLDFIVDYLNKPYVKEWRENQNIWIDIIGEEFPYMTTDEFLEKVHPIQTN